MNRVIVYILCLVMLGPAYVFGFNVHGGDRIFNGNVGIGASNPDEKLHISYGNLNFDATNSPYTNTSLGLSTANSGGTLLDSTKYCYMVTYYTADGETDTINRIVDPFASPSGAYAQTTGAGGAGNEHTITLGTIPVSADPEVIGRKIYRTVDGCGEAHGATYLIHTLADNTTTSWTDTGETLGTIINQVNTTGGQIFFEDNGVGGQGKTSILGIAAETTAIGWKAGENNHGLDNTFIGYRAGEGFETDCDPTTGTDLTCPKGKANVFIGDGAGMNYAGATSNVFIGSGAGIGGKNIQQSIFIGSHSGELGTTSDRNICLGANTCVKLTTEDDNICIGADSCNDLTGGGNVFIGDAVGDGLTSVNNRLQIDNSNTTSPLITGAFDLNTLEIGGMLAVDRGIATLSAGNVNISLPNLWKTLWRHPANGVGNTVTTQSASNMIAYFPNCQDGKTSWHFYLENTSTGGATTSVLTAGTGVTIDTDANATVAEDTTAHFLAVVTSCSSETVTIYSLGHNTH